ncbi:unnamed protein product [Colias eurytheme]|nr:unnamed protein product [Colias eurytheme]
MRVAFFVILCCALQYVTADAIDDALSNEIKSGRLETKKFNETDEFEYDQTGNVIERSTTTKEYEAFGDIDKDVTGDDVKVRTLVIKTDASGHETIWEEDVLIKKKGQTGSSAEAETSAASSSASSVPAGNGLGAGLYRANGLNGLNVQQRPGANSAAAAVTPASASGLGNARGNIVINNNGGAGSGSSASAASSTAGSGNEGPYKSLSGQAAAGPLVHSFAPFVKQEPQIVIINEENPGSASSSSSSSSSSPQPLDAFDGFNESGPLYVPYYQKGPQVVVINEGGSGPSASASASSSASSFGRGRGRIRQACQLSRRQFIIRVGRKGACADC